MRTWVPIGFALGITLAAAFGAEPADPLTNLRQGHPRLLLTNESLKAAVDAARSDPLRAAVHARIVATAESVLGAPSIQHLPPGDPSLDQTRYAVHYILTEAMAYRLTGDVRFLARVRQELANVVAFPDWNPGHFLDVGEMSFAVAVAYDWLYPQLTPDERARIKRALMEKALSFAERAYQPGGPVGRGTSWAVNTNNWNQVCNAGVLSAALALADEEPALARTVIAGVRTSLPRGMGAYAPDGEFPEGPGYWTYGTTYNVIALAELESSLGTDLGLSGAPGFAHTADYELAVQGPFGRAFNYADSTDDLQNSPACAWLAEKFPNPTMRRHTRMLLDQTLREGAVTPFDPTIQGQVVNRFFVLHAIWFPRDLPLSTAAPDLPRDLHFRGVADIALFRSAWNDPRAIFVGFKAGTNSNRHHNHLDLGSFVLDADGVRWAIDLGPDAYSLPGYFDYGGRRWNYFRLNNRSHNTLTPGDALQATGATAPITAFGGTPARAFAVADLSALYPGEATGLRRGVALLDRTRVLVEDEYQPKPSRARARWVMVTKAAVERAPDGRSAMLRQDGRTLRLEVLAPGDATLQVTAARPPTPVEKQNDGCSMLWMAVQPHDDTEPMRLAVLLTPQGEKWPDLPAPTVVPLAEWK